MEETKTDRRTNDKETATLKSRVNGKEGANSGGGEEIPISVSHPFF
jgi:hypothetical protein